MFRVASAIAFAALIASASLAPASADGARLTRIEPRPFYGATVTLEAGVRVFRPLPPTSHVIINPGHRTPLNVTIKDVRERHYIKGEFTHNYYNRGSAGSGGYVSGLPFGAYGYGRGYGRKQYGNRRGKGFAPYARRAPRFRRSGGRRR